jgi:hypothetical protein
MTPLLIVIPMSAANAAHAELLLDFIFELENKEQAGSCLLFVDPNVHAELRERVKIAAEIAFNHCDLVESTGLAKNPIDEIAAIVRDRYRSPWLLMEPDCVPLRKGWRNALAYAYDSQPYRFLGIKQQRRVNDATMFRVHPTAIYPPDGSLTTDKGVVMRTGATHLISLMNFEHGMTLDKIDQNAVLLKGDKTGGAIKLLRSQKPDNRIVDNQEVADEMRTKVLKSEEGATSEIISAPSPANERVTNNLEAKVPKPEPDTLPNSQQNGNGHIRSVFPESLEEAVRITKTKAKKRGRKKEATNG